MNTAEASFSLKKRWLMAAIVYFDMLAAFCNQFKAPSLFTTLIPTLGFTSGNIGWMMSMFSFVGIVLAFPAAFITDKLGIKKTLVVGAVFPFVGSVMGALAPDADIMLFSRLIEGTGVGLLSVSAASAIAVLIPRQRHGLAFGIRGITFPAGTVIGLNAAPLMFSFTGSWRTVWWAGAAMAAVALILLAVFFRVPPALENDWDDNTLTTDSVQSDTVKPDYRGLIVVGIVYLIWQFIWVGGYNSFYSTFLQQVHGLAPTQAGFMTSITSLMMIALGPISGIVSDKMHSRKALIVFCMVGTAIMFSFGWSSDMALVWVFLIGEGVFAPCVTTGTMAIIPDMAKRQDKVSFGMAINAFFKCIGMVIGAAAYGPIHLALGWSNASLFVLCPLAVAAALIAIFGIRETPHRKQ